MNSHPNKRRGPLMWLAGRSRRFWIAVALLPILYVASFGPACWISSRMNLGNWINFTALPTVYRPLLLAMYCDRRIVIAVEWYAGLGAASGWRWVNIASSDHYWISGPNELVWVKIHVNRPAPNPDVPANSD
jgi:hypothetical protein